ncbi:MAG: tRNA (adenosine(37)-N6)-threonylcarbamoyltransferase complex transferase subunit TsaD [Acidimicrobiales bacterium]
MTARGRVLGIETSCDETAEAVVDQGRSIVTSVVSSQVDLHARYGGVVPELAGRAHIELVLPVVTDALAGAGLDRRGRALVDPDGPVGIDAVAATIGPGLIGSLLVGVSTAKALALAWDVPFVGVNHLEGHLYAAMLEAPDLEVPVVVLLVSGGHTLLVALDAPGSYRVLGATVDDAAGEAFDKVARYLGLGYPGGPEIDRLSVSGDAGSIRFPRASTARALDFSFSGLKTAVISYVRAHPEVTNADVAAAFQEAVVDVLVQRAVAAATEIGARGACLAGGVAANSLLRARFAAAFEQRGLPSYLPSRAMCTDNAAMIAAAGYFQLERSGPTPLDTGAVPDLQLHSSG